MKQLSLLAAVLVVAACGEAPTAPRANVASPSDVAQVARRTAGVTAADCTSSATPTVWMFTGMSEYNVPVSGCIGFTPGSTGFQSLTFHASDGTIALDWANNGEVSLTLDAMSGSYMLDFTDGKANFDLHLTGLVSATTIPSDPPANLWGSSVFFISTSGLDQVLASPLTSLTLPTLASTAPQTKEQCKNGGSIGFYLNQGQCVSEMAKLKKK